MFNRNVPVFIGEHFIDLGEFQNIICVNLVQIYKVGHKEFYATHLNIN